MDLVDPDSSDSDESSDEFKSRIAQAVDPDLHAKAFASTKSSPAVRGEYTYDYYSNYQNGPNEL